MRFNSIFSSLIYLSISTNIHLILASNDLDQNNVQNLLQLEINNINNEHSNEHSNDDNDIPNNQFNFMNSFKNYINKFTDSIETNKIRNQNDIILRESLKNTKESFLSLINSDDMNIRNNNGGEEETIYYTSVPKENWKIDFDKYKDKYVIRIFFSDLKFKDNLIKLLKDLSIDIWEISTGNSLKFIDFKINSKDEGLKIFNLIYSNVYYYTNGEHDEQEYKFEFKDLVDLKFDILIKDLPQTIFETFPFEDDNYNDLLLSELSKDNTNDDVAPVDPLAVDIFFRQYRDLNTIYNWFDLLLLTYPNLLEVEWIGQTFEGRDIKALRLTSHKHVEDPINSKTVVITAGIHAREWISVSTACYILYRLLQDYEAGKKKANLFLQNMDFLFLPVMNPDGYDYSFKNERLWRKNRQETYLPRCFGIDIDHSFDFHFTRTYDSPCSEDYSGEGSFESLESDAWNKYLNQTKHDHPIYGYIDLHSYAQEVLYPYAYSCSELPRDEENLLELAYGLSKAIRLQSGKNYGVLNACQDKGSDMVPSMGSGSALDYMYHNRAYWAFVLKLRDSGSHGFLLPSKYIVPVGKEIYASIKYFSSFVLGLDD
ncbi:unnamed protein product [[Candida] boidinii]|uniref:Inactive metallocarboxypeptidase ECM14 n=1 Tax=Candida boidinii TaxID=5477 RepID=A0A9W6SZF9_CANBO|nr:hypothetical protein B5S30_g2074 [[Candida] boidinii]OWB86621.1 hypothetical protein B5S33_g5326 [[Candida] boidinii]GME69384.1 unnamed protein product [[Candida] boidinii]